MKIPYTSGGGKTPHSAPFKVVFKKDLEKYNIKAGEESKAYVIKMLKLDGIMVQSPQGEKDFYFVSKTEDDVLDILDFPDYISAPPAEESGTDVILPY